MSGVWSIIRRDGVGHYYVEYIGKILTGTPWERETAKGKTLCGQYTRHTPQDMDGLPDLEGSREFFGLGRKWCRDCIDRRRSDSEARS